MRRFDAFILAKRGVKNGGSGGIDMAGEPSLEDILASIKKVIAEDGAGSPAPRRRPVRQPAVPQPNSAKSSPSKPAPKAPAYDEVLELSDAMTSDDETESYGDDSHDAASDDGASQAFAMRHGQGKNGPSGGIKSGHKARNAVVDEDEQERDHDDDTPMVSASNSRSMRESLAALATLSEPRAAPQLVRSGETSLEELTRDLLRPMLAQWLDDNLPEMVEALVAKEIGRITKKRG